MCILVPILRRWDGGLRVDGVLITFRLMSICLVGGRLLFIYVYMKHSGCFAAHLFCTFCITYRPMLLQHAGGSDALHFYTAFFLISR